MDEQRDRPDYTRLPEPIRLEETVASTDVEPGHDPEGGRNTDTDFLLRYGA